jgi:hypothetical protein
MGRSKRKLANIEEYNFPDSAIDVTSTSIRTQVHSEYASGQAARHWTISTPTIHEPLTGPDSFLTLAENPDVAQPATLDWSQANSDTSAHIEVDVELTEMEDCELEALGLMQFLKKSDKSSRIPSDSEKTNRSFTQSVSGFLFFQFISALMEVLEQSTTFLDPLHRCLCRTNPLP